MQARQGQDATPPPDPGEQIFNLPKKSAHAASASSPTAGLLGCLGHRLFIININQLAFGIY